MRRHVKFRLGAGRVLLLSGAARATPDQTAPAPQCDKTRRRCGRRSASTNASSAVAAGPQEHANRFLHRRRHLRHQRLARHVRDATVGVEERHAIRTLRKVRAKSRSLIVGQRTFEVIETELDELLATDHGVSVRPVKSALTMVTSRTGYRSGDEIIPGSVAPESPDRARARRRCLQLARLIFTLTEGQISGQTLFASSAAVSARTRESTKKRR